MKKEAAQLLQNFHISFGGWMKCHYKHIVGDINLTMTQFQVLFILDGLGLCNMSNLSEAAETSKGTMTCMLNKLVEEGYVERSGSLKDRRNVYVSLTPEGKKIIDTMKERILEGIGEVLEELNDKEKESIYKSLAILTDVFKEKK